MFGHPKSGFEYEPVGKKRSRDLTLLDSESSELNIRRSDSPGSDQEKRQTGKEDGPSDLGKLS